MIKSMRMSLILSLSLLFSLAMFVSCEDRNKVRKYREKGILVKTKVNVGQKETPLSEPGERAVKYQWYTPEG